MAKIQPITFPLNQGVATEMSVLILNFETSATTCTTYYELKTDEGKILQSGNCALTNEQFSDWGNSNRWVEECVADAIGVVLL